MGLKGKNRQYFWQINILYEEKIKLTIARVLKHSFASFMLLILIFEKHVGPRKVSM